MIPRALVLTAGLGTRMRPLSYIRAKAAVPIAGEPLGRRIVRWLSGHGVRDLVLNLHHLPHTITGRLGDGEDLGARDRYHGDLDLGSAGGPRKALGLLGGDRFFIVNGDTLTDVDLSGLAEAHARSKALVTLAVTRNPAPERYSGPLVDDNGTVTDFVGRGSSASCLFVGVQLVDRSVFEGLPMDQPAESVSGWTARCSPGVLAAFRPSEATHHSGGGNPRRLLADDARVREGRGLPSRPGGRTSRIHPTARLVDTEVWDDVDIGADVDLTCCIVGDGASIPSRGTIRPLRHRPGAGPASCRWRAERRESAREGYEPEPRGMMDTARTRISVSPGGRASADLRCGWCR